MKKILIVCSVLALVGVFAPVAYAQFSPTPITIVGTPVTLREIDALIRQIATFLIIIAMAIAVITIVWAGITYMAAGSNDTKIGLARQRLFAGIIGALIVLAVGVILNTIAGLVTRSFFS